MAAWRAFWTVFCGAGVLSFIILLIVIIPTGWLDLRRLFATLEARAATAAAKRDQGN